MVRGGELRHGSKRRAVSRERRTSTPKALPACGVARDHQNPLPKTASSWARPRSTLRLFILFTEVFRMARLRWVCFAGLLVGSAALLGVGCSDDSGSKKRGGTSGEAGEAGEPAVGGGNGGGGAGGHGGMPAVAGEGGTPSEAGQGGAPTLAEAGAAGASIAEAGAAGAGPLGPDSCTPSGNVGPVTLPGTPITVCRAARVESGFTSNSGDPSFGCCGVSDTSRPYGVAVSGISSDGGGQLSFVVPADAPLGAQSVKVTCSSGQATNSFQVVVTDTPAPVVTGLDSSFIFGGDTLVINGSNLGQVSRVVAVPVGAGQAADCAVDSAASTASSISCVLDALDGDYTVVVEQSDCGFAVNTPVVTVATPH
jgi:hypothetical protein